MRTVVTWMVAHPVQFAGALVALYVVWIVADEVRWRRRMRDRATLVAAVDETIRMMEHRPGKATEW